MSCGRARTHDHRIGSQSPQGSILGPLSFILFMNDFLTASEIFFIILFTDDTSVFLAGTEYAKLIELLNVELERVSCWLNANYNL